MSCGSPIVPIRIPTDLLRSVDLQIVSSAPWRAGLEWTRTGFIIAAIREKLAKMQRSRCRRRPTPAPELLTALEDVLQMIATDELIPESVSYIKAARAAIAKARVPRPVEHLVLSSDRSST
jgi:hypothetical protein